MKHIKYFESHKLNDEFINSLKLFCEENLINLIDNGFSVNLDVIDTFISGGVYRHITKCKPYIKIEIRKDADFFMYNNVKDNFIPFLTILNDEYNVFSINFVDEDGSIYIEKKKRIINDNCEITYDISHININLKVNNLKYFESNFSDFSKIYYRGVGKEEAIKSLELGNLIYYSNDPITNDWEVIEYSLGDSASEMSEDDIDEYLNELVPWNDIHKGVNLTKDIDNAGGYSDIVFGVKITGNYSEFGNEYIFAENPNECIIIEIYYKGNKITKNELLETI